MEKKRQKISELEFNAMFATDELAEKWFENNRWGNNITCAHCDSARISIVANKKPLPYHCKSCRKYFSVRTNSLMDNTKLGYRVWAVAMYKITTSLKGIASTKLASDLGITQKHAWHLAHRIREALNSNDTMLRNVVEADETYVGGKAKNFSRQKRATYKRENDNKTIVIGIKQRDTKKVIAMPIANTLGATLQHHIKENVALDSVVYTDEANGYKKLCWEYKHASVNHSAWEYKKGDAHTNGIESFWSMLKRGYYGTFHHYSPKHTHRYVNEFAGRHNDRQADTMQQLSNMVQNLQGKVLRYAELIK